jgi:hypothetical protein
MSAPGVELSRVMVVPGRELETMLIEDPVDLAAFGLEAIRRVTSIPWWGVIPAAAFGFRLTIGRVMLSANTRARARHLGVLAQELAKNSQEASFALSTVSGAAAKRSVVLDWLRRRRTILSACEVGHFHRNAFAYGHVVLSALQLLAVRHLTVVDASLASEGALWFPSLVDSDPLARLAWIAAGLGVAR